MDLNAFLPVSKTDMQDRGWWWYDFLLVTGDAYVDHPTFGAAVIGRVLEAEGYLYGQIAREEAGSNGFGYDPLFYLPDYGCTSAQISPQEKNRISHRAQALQRLLEKLKEEA